MGDHDPQGLRICERYAWDLSATIAGSITPL
ncbi:hypothetical protein KOAAANKH_02106 [Brevundimonas sp. NIBR10]|nr:hypothetical protein KOAAANKH_02106 [Brevundimonas sp. NIBR10]